MAMGPYNGWAGKIREQRGLRQAEAHKTGALAKSFECELCHKTRGLTYHAEEYGSTWQDFLNTLHCLCPYCHGILHVRFKYPNRYLRYKARLAAGAFEEILPFNTLGSFFGVLRGLEDIEEQPLVDSGVPWLDAIPLEGYSGPPKIALTWFGGVLIPDPLIYKPKDKPVGVRFDTVSGKILPYESP